MARYRPARFDERLTLVEHLDELRTRIVICVVVLGVINAPLPTDKKPITLSPTEPFLTTFKVSAYAGIIIALPVLLYELYAFMLPALSPAEKRVVLPFLVLVAVLFIGGVVFGYFIVLPAAIKFLLNFNN